MVQFLYMDKEKIKEVTQAIQGIVLFAMIGLVVWIAMS